MDESVFVRASRRYRLLAIGALAPTILLTALLGPPFAGSLMSGNLESTLSVVLPLSLAWVATAFAFLLYASDTRFQADGTGFTPRNRPFRHVVGRKRRVNYEEISAYHIWKTEDLWIATVQLRDGTLLSWTETEGVPRVAFEEIARHVPERTVVEGPRASPPTAREPQDSLVIRMDPGDFRRRHQRLRALACASSVILLVFLGLVTVLGPRLFTWLAAPLAFAAIFVPLVFLGWLVARLALMLLIDTPFEMTEEGLVPRFRPIGLILRGTSRISFREVTRCFIAKRPDTWTATIHLADGAVLHLVDRDGIPRAAFDELAKRVPAEVIALVPE